MAGVFVVCAGRRHGRADAAGAVSAGLAIDQIADSGVDFARLVPLLVQIVACVAATAAIQWVMNVVNNRVTFNVVRDLREDALKKIEILPLAYIDSHPHGEIVSRVIADADAFADGPADGLHAAVHRRADHIGHAGVHVLHARGHRGGRGGGHAAFVVRGEFIAQRTHDMFWQQSETRGEMTATSTR